MDFKHLSKEEILRQLEEIDRRDLELRENRLKFVQTNSDLFDFPLAVTGAVSGKLDEPAEFSEISGGEKESTLLDFLDGAGEKISSIFDFRAEENGMALREKILAELPGMREDLETEFSRRESERMAHIAALEWKLEQEKNFSAKNSLMKFAALALFVLLLAPSFALIGNAFNIKNKIEEISLGAYGHLSAAKNDVKNFDFASAETNFNRAYYGFLKVSNEIGVSGGIVVDVLKNIPGFEKLSSGANLLESGKYLAAAGENASAALEKFANFDFKSVFAEDGGNSGETVTDKIFAAKKDIESARQNLLAAGIYLNKVEAADLPEISGEISKLRESLPSSIKIVGDALNVSDIILESLGHYQPKKYLLIFQNPSEARAAGGFIGSYGLLDLSKGRLANLFIDGIFNPDGQLREKIIPPKPIQRISTAWSAHDANWFFDFPMSAQKIVWFYEKTGGATPDGVIALTPKVIERLLDILGPIPMPEYGITLTSKNLLERLQYETEINYDKELNKPKQILADAAPKIFAAVAAASLEEWGQIIASLAEGLEEKDIMLYSLDSPVQNFILSQGWGGNILETDKDYLAVVHSNINGFKTDKVIEENFSLESEIQSDGSIVDTLTINRKHLGGKETYDYWNKVNADYLRVYVPLGSKLLSASGHTLDVYVPPIDYENAGFKADPDVAKIESTMTQDPQTGTQIFEESGKTVFGNWTYVSPGESLTAVYKYLLPFKIDFSAKAKNHGIFIQRQASLNPAGFSAGVKFSRSQKTIWNWPEDLKVDSNSWQAVGVLEKDMFFGGVFE